MVPSHLSLMPNTVRFYGLARNLHEAPIIIPDDTEVWISNNFKSYYNVRLPRLNETNEWTRWFNLHSTEHMKTKYPDGYKWYKHQTKPIYLRDVDPDIPTSLRFPRQEIQDHFGGPQMGSPGRFFTCSVCWLTAFAIYEKEIGIKDWDRFEFWGFALVEKPARSHTCYKFERPCFFYWVNEAKKRGIEVIYQEAIQKLPFEPGDPKTYTGPLYGYCTNEPFDPCCKE